MFGAWVILLWFLVVVVFLVKLAPTRRVVSAMRQQPLLVQTVAVLTLCLAVIYGSTKQIARTLPYPRPTIPSSTLLLHQSSFLLHPCPPASPLGGRVVTPTPMMTASPTNGKSGRTATASWPMPTSTATPTAYPNLRNSRTRPTLARRTLTRMASRIASKLTMV